MRTKPRLPIWRAHPSAALLLAQLVLLVMYAIFDGQHSERAFLSTFGLVVVVLRVWVIDRGPGPSWLAWALAIPAVLLSAASIFTTSRTLVFWSALVDAMLYFYAAASLIASMMEDYLVTVDELFAAGATYTLLAWGFAYLYMLVQLLVPGSFVSSAIQRETLTFVELLFVSFTNLSATGLSDIVPVTTPARVIVMLEQFFGVAYIAIVISRLVSLTVQKQHDTA